MTGPAYQGGDRRPIASRDRRIFQRLAHTLAVRSVSPNTISIAGMAAGCAGGLLLGLTSYTHAFERACWIAAAFCVQLRLLANMLDGMVAVESRKASPLGELYNEVPDRVSDAAILIGLGYATGGNPLYGYAATAVAIFTAYVRAAGKVAGAHQEFCGPMAKPQRMFVVTVICLYTGLAPGSLQPDWGLAQVTLLFIIIGGLLTAIRRLWRIAAALKGSGFNS